jgi:hypothetical protein
VDKSSPPALNLSPSPVRIKISPPDGPEPDNKATEEEPPDESPLLMRIVPARSALPENRLILPALLFPFVDNTILAEEDSSFWTDCTAMRESDDLSLDRNNIFLPESSSIVAFPDIEASIRTEPENFPLPVCAIKFPETIAMDPVSPAITSPVPIKISPE